MKKFRKIFAALLSITILGTTVPTNLSLTASAAYVTTNGTIVVTQSEYNEFCAAWKNKGVSYLKVNYNPSAKEKKMVKILQKILCCLGYNVSVDGIYGKETRAAVGAMQKNSNGYLVVDYCFGNASWNYVLSKMIVEKAETKICFSSMITPSVLNVGNSFNLGGTITSAGEKIWCVSGSIVDSTGRTVIARNDIVNAYSFNIRKSSINTYLKFGTLCEGDYTLCYTVTATDGVKKEYTTSFTVTDKNEHINSAIVEGMKQVKKDIGEYNGWSVFKEPWCADYASRYIRTYCDITSVKANANVGGLAANITNSNSGILYLYSEEHYNAVKKEANGGNVYRYAQFDKTGLKNTKLVSKTDVIPQHGDLILFRWSGSKTEISHIGIVDNMSNDLKYVNTIEGNTTFNGTKNSNYVNAGQRTYNNSYIIGIIRFK